MIDQLLREMFTYNPNSGVVAYRRTGKPAGAVMSTGYLRIRVRTAGRRVEVAAHRVGWFLHYGAWPTKDLDHIDGDKLNNRIANLREATPSQNMANTGPYKNNTSGFRGVSKTKYGNFQAAIGFKGKSRQIGTFKTAEAAARAYDEVAVRLHGEFAKTNF